jgi:hypothetical protein
LTTTIAWVQFLGIVCDPYWNDAFKLARWIVARGALGQDEFTVKYLLQWNIYSTKGGRDLDWQGANI